MTHFSRGSGTFARRGHCDGCGRYQLDLKCGTPARASGLPRHVSLCPDCRDYLKRTHVTLDAPGWHPAPGHFRHELLELIAPTPDAPNERWFYDDLPQLTVAELRAERAQERLRLLLEERPSGWHIDRLRRVEAFLRHVAR